MSIWDSLQTNTPQAPQKSGGFWGDIKKKEPVSNFSVPSTNTAVANSNPSIASSPKSSSEIIKNVGTTIKDVFTGSDNTTGGVIRNTFLDIPNQFMNVPKNIGTGFWNMIARPDNTQKDFESKMLPYASNSSPVTKALTAPGVAAARIITRVINPGLLPFAENLAQIYEISRPGGFADQISQGRLPASYLDELAVLQKTAPQVVGDVTQAVLTAYSGGQAENLLNKSLKQPIKKALTTGFGSGLKVGTGFGVGAALSSGTTNPMEFLSITGTSGAAGGMLGAITSGAIPVSRELLVKVNEAKAAYDLLTPKEKQGGFAKNPFAGKATSPLTPLQEQRQIELQVRKEALDGHPLNQVSMRNMTSEGNVRELGDVKNPNLAQKIQDAQAATGISDPTKFAEELTAFRNQKALLVAEEKAFKAEVAGNTTTGKTATEAIDLNVAQKERERGFVTSAKEVLPEATKIAGQYIPRDTDTLSIKARNFIKDNIGDAEKFIQSNIDDNVVAVTSELLKHYAKEASKTTDIAIKNAIYEKAAEVANNIAEKLTETGRTIQAASILGKLTPEGQVRFAAREIQKYNESVPTAQKIPELTGEQTGKILQEMNDIGLMPDGTKKAIKFKELQDYISSVIPSPLIKKVSNVWKAGLLTGVQTTGLNIFANISHFVTETAKDIPAKSVDSVVSLFTGKKTIGGVTIGGTLGGVKEGFKKGLLYLKTGFDERNVATKYDYHKVNYGKGKFAKAIQKYEETVFGVMGATDQPFYYGAKARSIVDQAKAQAKNEKNKGAEKTKFIENLIQNPTDDMLRYATLDAQTAVFQNNTSLGDAAKKIQEIAGGAGEFVLPFGRTPSSVAMQIINYSPAGIVKTLVENIGKGKFDQRLFSQGMGRAVLGTGVLAIGGMLMKNNLMNLDYPATEKEQKLWELEGRKPNTILIDGKWRSIQVLGPAGNVLLIGGHFESAFAKSGSPTEAISVALLGSAKSFTEQTFLQGLNTAVQAINNPDRYAETFVGGFFASFIPTIVSNTARTIDTKERKTNNIADRVKARIPGVRESLQPQVDVLGNERARVGNSAEVMLDPTRPSEAKTTPVITELRRLSNIGHAVSPSLLGDKNGFAELTPEQNTALWKRSGEIVGSKLNNLFLLKEYKDLSDEDKAKKVSNIISKSQTVARVDSVIKITQGLRGEELKTKLSELKKGGILTKSVFDQYVQVRSVNPKPQVKGYSEDIVSIPEMPMPDNKPIPLINKVLGVKTASAAEIPGNELKFSENGIPTMGGIPIDKAKITPTTTPINKLIMTDPRKGFSRTITDPKKLAIAQQIAGIANSVAPEYTNYLLRIAEYEGKLDPEETNDKNTNGSIDRGIFQINTKAFPQITEEQARDVKFSTLWAISLIQAGKQHKWVADQYIKGKVKLKIN